MSKVGVTSYAGKVQTLRHTLANQMSSYRQIESETGYTASKMPALQAQQLQWVVNAQLCSHPDRMLRIKYVHDNDGGAEKVLVCRCGAML